MTTKATIEEKLTRAFSPTELGVIDESDRHAGHSGWKEGGETHFRIEVVSKAFAGKSRVEAHRMVNEVLAEELNNGVHALAIKTRAE
ncbi:BolA protein family transcriptional regulator [Breoghania corrubedonensis]|uniref:BolA protein family transcriptional regulator n=1 Tax=Breoghania corrubedonensis TaxID=665038 RepID=A0A2T5UW99_9HYPH|nr:BolA family protein [Breoghania corrubedonensis]PTW55770.1 BolA protein family transcriptional regulator [Breoghania corrubedonensis]